MDFNVPLESLRCTSCKNFLSHFPIFSGHEVNICGRCPQTEATLLRNSLYEEVAQHLIFPCRYQTESCFEEIQPKDVPQHEKTCPHKPIECPLAGTCQCEWSGSSRNLLQHCRYKHSTKFLGKDTFNVDLTQSNDNIHLLEHSDSLLMVATRFDAADMLFLCAVYHPRHALENAQFSGQLSLENGNRVMLVRFTTSSSKELCFTEVSLDSLKTRKEELPSSISARISMGTDEDDHYKAQVPNNVEVVLLCEECPNTLVPPIYYCLTKNRFLCSSCFDKHMISRCQCFSVKVRSQYLEKIATLINYPCKNKKYGCPILTTCDQIKIHQQSCFFKGYHCPIKECTWTGTLDNTKFHIEGDHSDSIHSNSLQIFLTLKANYERHHFIKIFGLLFLIFIKTNYGTILCYIKMVGKGENGICYQFQITNLNDKNKQLIVRTPSSIHEYCSFSRDEIIPYLSLEGVFDFKVTIIKNSKTCAL